jgi:hypothetical protein
MSNLQMALPILHTFHRNISMDAILAGKYSNIRIHGLAGNMNSDLAWTTLQNAVANTSASTTTEWCVHASHAVPHPHQSCLESVPAPLICLE